MRRVVSVVLIILIITISFSWVCADEMVLIHSLPLIGEELIINGSFEKEPSGQDWSAFKGAWGNNVYTSYVEDPLKQNGHCVKVTDMLSDVTGAVSNPFVKQEVKVVPGAKYVLTGKIFSEKPETGTGTSQGTAVIKLEFFNENSGEAKLGSYKGTNGKWVPISHEIDIPVTASSMRILLRQQGVGHMYFDDISLKMTEAPKAIHVQTDEVFYYSDYTEMGVATASLNTSAYPELKGKNVDFYLKKGSKVLAMALSVPSIEDKAVFKYDLALLTELKTAYTIEVNISGFTESFCENSWLIYKYERPLALDSGGIYRRTHGARAGEIVNPVFAYRYRNYQFEIGKKNGIAIAQLAMPQNKDGSYYSDEDTIIYLTNALNTAAKSGVMCMIALYRSGKPAGNEINRATTERVVKALSNHEALFAWMVMDETFTHFVNPYEDLRISYITIRNNDPYHPVYLCEATARLEEAGRYADILTVDPYPASYLKQYDNNPTSPYAAASVFPTERVSAAVDAVKNKKPVYSLLQAFRWEDNYPDYFPSGDEMRSMIYGSFMAGASGVGYFKFDNSDGTTDLNDTALWPYITEFALKEQEDAFNAFVHKKYKFFNTIKTDAYWVTSFVKDDTIHLIVQNRLKTDLDISVPLVSTDKTKYVKGFSAFCIAGGTLKANTGYTDVLVSVPAKGTASYKILPKEIGKSNFVLYEHFENGKEGWISVDNFSDGIKCVKDEIFNTYLKVSGKTGASLNRAEYCTEVLPSNETRYRISFKAKALSAGSIPRLDVYGIRTDGNGEVVIQKNAHLSCLSDVTSDDWMEYVYYFTVTGEDVTRLRLRFHAQAGMQVGYDDIIVEPERTDAILHIDGMRSADFSKGETVSVRLHNAESKDMRFVVVRCTKSMDNIKSTENVSFITIGEHEEDVTYTFAIPNSSEKQEIFVYGWYGDTMALHFPFYKIFGEK